jgi:signal transduction histidine kinase
LPRETRIPHVSKRMPWIEFAMALTVLVVVAVASDAITSRLESAQYWVVHTHEVETATAQARGDVVAAAEARQSYIITSDPTVLAEYERAKGAIPGELSRLEQMTADNPAEQANVAQLRQIIGRQLGLLQQSIDLGEQSGTDAQQQIQWTRDGLALQNQSLAVFDTMRAEEDRLMAVRQTISSRTYDRVRIVLLVSFAIVVSLLAINFYDLSRELRERKQAEEAVQRLSGRILRVQDEERRRVARELHDSIGQTFALLKMNLEMLARTVGTTDPQQTRDLLIESVSILETGLSGTRTLSHLLHPPLLDEMGFASAAKWLVDGFSQRSNIKVKLEIPDDLPRMPQDVELALFRILQEGLTNVHKHSGSSLVETKVISTTSNVWLSLKDFGRGMPSYVIANFNRSRPNLGVGLAGMRERVRDLGGRLELKSDGKGALVEVSIPLTGVRTMQSPDPVTDASTID